MANIVSAAIFGDGAACVLLSSHEEDEGPEILAEEMYHFYDNIHMMGFKLTNSGLQMVLDIEVPETIASHFPDIIHPFSFSEEHIRTFGIFAIPVGLLFKDRFVQFSCEIDNPRFVILSGSGFKGYLPFNKINFLPFKGQYFFFPHSSVIAHC